MEHINGNNFDFLIGKKIIEVRDGDYSEYELVCDDGTIIEFDRNEGCGGCSNGWSSIDDLKILEDSNNAITNVKCQYDNDDEDLFTLFIYYENGIINTLKGDDGYGNGYYGGGFYINIKNVESKGE